MAANGNYTVTFTYTDSGVASGYLNVNYVDQSGKAIKDAEKTKHKAGETYAVTAPAIQGYQLDTTKYPAKSSGTFTGDDVTLNFVYKPLSTTTTTVHYYNSNGWSNIICYGYDENGQVTGTWNTSPVMTSEGNNWFKTTINSPSLYVMFHPKSGTGQEPGENEPGYPASGEVWIQNKVVTFNATLVTSHIDVATGKQISQDVTVNKTKVTSNDTYTTSALAGRTDVIAPANAQGSYTAGVTNVVYLYGDTEQPTQPTTAPTQPTEPTVTEPTKPTETEPTEPTVTEPTQPTEPVPHILIGDVNMDGKIKVDDATLIQRAIGKIVTLSEQALIAADPEPTTEPYTEPIPTEPPTDPPIPSDRVTFDGTFPEENDKPANWFAWTWDDGTDGEWVTADADSSDVAHIYFSGLKSHVIFVRMDPAAATPSWDAKWNQTNDLDLVAGGTYTITGWGSGWGANLDGVWS